MTRSQSQLKPVAGSELPISIRRAAANLLELAGDEREVVLLARITQLEAVDEPERHFLDLPKQIKFTFETFALTEHFDPEQPEWLLRRTDEGTINTEDLLADDTVGNVPDWIVLEWSGNAKDIGLPAECYDKLAEEIEYLHEGEIEEWLGLGNSVPDGLSEGVAAIYAKYADESSNDNIEDAPAPKRYIPAKPCKFIPTVRHRFTDIPSDVYDALSRRALLIIGVDVVLGLLPEQANTLDRFLGEMLEKYGSLDQITDAMIVGQYEMMLHFMPADLVLAYHESEKARLIKP